MKLDTNSMNMWHPRCLDNCDACQLVKSLTGCATCLPLSASFFPARAIMEHAGCHSSTSGIRVRCWGHSQPRVLSVPLVSKGQHVDADWQQG